MDAKRSAYAVLTTSPKVERLRNRHRDYYLFLAEEAAGELRGRDQVAWLEVLEAERDNIRSAIEWSLQNEDEEAALRLTAALAFFWTLRGYHVEVRHWFDKALALGAGSPSVHRAKALGGAGAVADRQGPDKQVFYEGMESIARELADERLIAQALRGRNQNEGGLRIVPQVDQIQEALEISRKIGDELEIADSMLLLADNTWGEEKVQLLQELLERYRKLGDRWGTAWVLFGLGYAAYMDPDPSVPLAYFEEAVELGEELDAQTISALGADALCWLALLRGDRALADRAVERGLALCRRGGDPSILAWLLVNRAQIALEFGDPEGARRAVSEGMAIVGADDEAASGVWYKGLTVMAGWIAQSEGDAETAQRLCRDAVKAHRAVDLPSDRLWVFLYIGRVALAQRDYALGRDVLTEVVEMGRANPWTLSALCWGLCDLGELARTQGKYEEAEVCLAEAEADGLSRAPDPLWSAVVHDAQARLARIQGNIERAAALHQKAVDIAYGLRCKPQVATCLDHVAATVAGQGELEKAARIFGAAEGLRTAMNYWIPFWEKPGYEEDVAAARSAAADESAFDAVWAAGREMGADEAVRFALAALNDAERASST